MLLIRTSDEYRRKHFLPKKEKRKEEEKKLEKMINRKTNNSTSRMSLSSS